MKKRYPMRRYGRRIDRQTHRPSTGERPLRFEPLEARWLLAGVVVGNNLDVVNGDTSSIANLTAPGGDGGDGISLREAINAANSTGGADEVLFDAALSGQTLLLGGTEIEVTEALTIDARALAENFVIDAQQDSRIFDINGGANDFDVTLAGLTLTGGEMMGTNPNFSTHTFSGGAIRSLSTGDLTIEQTSITDSQVIGARTRGGGVFTLGDLTLSQSTISGNSADNSGGGIYARFSDVTLTQSTISGNSSDFYGGGIFGQNVTITQSTVAENFAGFAGGGILATGNMTVTGSVVAANSALNLGPDLFTENATAQYSLIGDGSDATINNVDGTSQIGTSEAPIDPLLGPLADYGGPTQTHALLPDSPAIEAGDPAIAFDPDEFDQRGLPFLRVFDGDGVGGARIDMGAYELQSITLEVDTTSDEVDGDHSAGELSLREAIALTNANPGADTITFDASVDGGIVLMNLGEMQITDALTIDATSLAGGFTIDAQQPQQQSRIFNIDDGGAANDFDVTIAGLVLTGGKMDGDNSSNSDYTFNGGAIRSLSTGDLRIDQTRITYSTVIGTNTFGGGIFSLGDVTLTDSTISGNAAQIGGGGIHADDVTLTQSTVSGNTAGRSGGGIFSLGDVTLTDSTISGNSAGNSGGGIWADWVTLTQSTVSGNSAGDSGGGILAFSNVTLTGSIVEGNTADSSGPDLFVPFGSASAEYSLIGDGSDATIIDNGGNLIGTGEEPIDPLLGPLADNGGPTMTHALLPDSPAIDGGNPAIAFDPDEFDQRGAPFLRVFDGNGDGTARIDIGAFEFKPLIVDTLLDESDGDFSSGDFSLREAIEVAHATPGADLIVFAPSLSGGTILLTAGPLTIEDALSINAMALAAPLTIDAQQQLNTNIFNVTDGLNETTLDVAISGLTLTGGNMTSPFPNNIGGAIRNRENLTVTSSTISGNAADSGGGIHTVYGSLTVINSTISYNTAGFGGGISSNPFTHMAGQRKTMIINSTVSGNTATNRGGGIYVSGGFNMISHSTITDNTAPPDRGSGIVSHGDGGTNAPLVQISSSIIAGNNDTDVDLVFGTMISFLSDGYNLVGIGNATGAFVEPGDQAGVTDPLLGPLADNGGPTLTHALMPNSPAIDAGDPVFDPDDFDPPLVNDQRGAGFSRVANGRIDIGAYEAQTVPPALPGDYNENGAVDAADYVLWRKTLATTGVPPYSGADGDGDGDITPADYAVWTTNFGETLPPPGAGSGAAAAASFSRDPTASADGAVARPESATGVEEPDATTTSFAKPHNVPPDSFNFARTSSTRTTRPMLPVADRLAPVQRSQLDLLLTASAIAKSIEHSPDSRRSIPGDRLPDDDAIAIDDAFETLTDWLL